MQIPKYTGNKDQYLGIKDQLHFIPRKTLVVPNAIALHSHPRYWGEDADVWRPSRWIDTPSTTLSQSLHFERETLYTPRKGSFVPWSDGPRVCPGKKFAQVEFVAVIARLFRTHRAHPVPRAGENADSARQRAADVVKDSHMTFLLQMRDPSRVALSWSPK